MDLRSDRLVLAELSDEALLELVLSARKRRRDALEGARRARNAKATAGRPKDPVRSLLAGLPKEQLLSILEGINGESEASGADGGPA